VSTEAVARPKPPAWPEKGTPEYEERLARMRQGHQKRTQKAAQKAPAVRTAPPVEEADLIDVGEPGNARMAPEPKADKPKAKGGTNRGNKEFDQQSVQDHIQMGLDILARMPGREHWHRDPDEIEILAKPATRILNRLDKKLIERLRTVSDPAALVFACVMVLGPSVMEELRNVRPLAKGTDRRQARPQPERQQQQPAGQVDIGPGEFHFADTAPISSNGAVPISPPQDIPSVGI
jgi:hypothetical protein